MSPIEMKISSENKENTYITKLNKKKFRSNIVNIDLIDDKRGGSALIYNQDKREGELVMVEKGKTVQKEYSINSVNNHKISVEFFGK
jgi:hypothetical protein